MLSMAVNGESGCPAVSRELLSVGSGGGNGIHDTLLLQSNNAKTKASGQQIIRLPVSNLVDKVQNFLPQIAKANEKLRKDMEGSCAQDFDIEHVDGSTENIIEMNVAFVELSDSDTDEEEFTSEDSSECEDSPVPGEVTVHNMKLPKPKREGRVVVLESKKNE